MPHSAIVHIWLRIGDHILEVAQLGPDFLLLRAAAAYPPTPAEITMSIDGHEQTWAVSLPDGITAARVRLAGDNP